ncbi:MAG: hypothetical protein ABFC96_01445 [Thermoguttaceae bacterium]
MTADNNGMVFLWQAIGREGFPKEATDEYARWLGVSPASEKRDCFVDAEEYAKGRPDAKELLRGIPERWYEEYRAAIDSPWSAEELPFAADWLAANERPLTLLVEASKRPRCWEPLIGHRKEILEGTGVAAGVERAFDGLADCDFSLPVPLHTRGLCLKAGNLLLARAMLRVGEGRSREAWRDVLVYIRLAELLHQSPEVLFVECDIAASMRALGCCAAQKLLHRGNLSADELAAMRNDLANLPKSLPLPDHVDKGVRGMCLDWAVKCARQGTRRLKDTYASNEDSGKKGGIDPVLTRLEAIDDRHIDWDAVLRLVNTWFDRSVDAMRRPTHAERLTSLRQIKNETNQIIHEASKDRVKVSNEAILAVLFFRTSLPESAAMQVGYDRAEMWFELTKLAFALAHYRADHGSYPRKAGDLVPKYVNEIAKDIFNDSDLHYTSDGNTYLLYSVGPNGRDDGGKGVFGQSDRDGRTDGDDLAIRGG